MREKWYYQLDAAFVKVSNTAIEDSDSQDKEDASGLGNEDSENPVSLNPSSEDNIIPGIDKVTFNFIATIIYFIIFFSLGKLFAQFTQARSIRKTG